MKPNLIVYHPSESAPDSLVETICEKLSGSHYVYLIRPGSEFRDDSPAGVRFLNHTLDRLPGFADVGAAIAIGSEEVAERLRQAYPSSGHAFWDPANGMEFPVDAFSASLPTIVRGDFGSAESADDVFDKAM